jgi:hypothetical protein
MLSAPATVTFRIERVLAGRSVAGRCVPATRRNRLARSCHRTLVLPGRFTQTGGGGQNTLVFRGHVAGRTLTPGSYRLLAAAPGTQGAGAQVMAPFRIVS